MLKDKKFNYYCGECEMEFDIVTEYKDEVIFFCPFCGSEINLDDNDDELDDDFFNEWEI